MKKRLVFGMIIVALVGFTSVFLGGNEVSAYKCSSSVVQANISLKRACKIAGTDGICTQPQCGAAWINASKETESEASFSPKTEITTNISGQANIYLHGAVLHTTNSNDVLASHIYIVKGSKRISGTAINGKTDYAAFSFCSGVTKANCTLSRPGIMDGQDIKSKTMTIKLDIDKLAELETPKSSSEKGDEYDLTFQVYRCYGTFSPSDDGGDHCYSDTSKFETTIAPTFAGYARVAYSKDGVVHQRKTPAVWQSFKADGSSQNNARPKAEVLYRDDCDDGCSFTFRHYLNRKSSKKVIKYTITRTSNYSGNGLKTETVVDSAEFKPSKNNENVEVHAETGVKLVPGQVVCETLIFDYGATDKRVHSTACAAAKGTVRASLELKAKKEGETNSQYRDDDIYAKPGDTIYYRVNYDPAPQYAATLKVKKMRLNGPYSSTEDTNLWSVDDTPVPNLGDSAVALRTFYNAIYAKVNELNDRSFAAWNNAFSLLYSKKNRTFTRRDDWDKKYTIGSTDTVEEVFSGGAGSEITSDDVGKTIIMRAQTNHNDDSKVSTVPSQVKFTEEIDEMKEGQEVVIGSQLTGNLVIDIQGSAASAENKENIQVANMAGTGDTGEKWILIKNSDGTYTIKNPTSGKVLDVEGGCDKGTQIAEDTNIQLYKSNGSDAQKWTLVANKDGNGNKDGTYTFKSQCKDQKGRTMAIDVAGGATVSGTNVRVHHTNDTNAQKWNIVRDQYTAARLQTTYLSDESNVIVPYNFRNETTIDANETKLYAGESSQVTYRVNVKSRNNSKVGADYATIVPKGGRYGVTCTIEGSNEAIDCSEDGVTEHVSNTAWKVGDNIGGKVTITVPDVPAGTKICLQSWVWPADSGAYTNTSIDGFSTENATSDKVCIPVAKRPSLQVWGGNVYTNGNIVTSVSRKKKLDGYDTGGNVHVFGSFSELGVVSTGGVDGFASGATTGYASLGDSAIIANYANNRSGDNSVSGYGGTVGDDFCKRSILTFSTCNGKAINGTVSSTSEGNNDITGAADNKIDVTGKLSEIREALDDLDDAPGFSITSTSDSGNVDVRGRDNTYYYYSVGGLYVGGVDRSGISLGAGTLLIVHATDDVRIRGNIIYGDSYRTLAEVPKMVIYAEQDVYIACDVGRVDALIIAERNVNTCYTKLEENPDYINNAENSNQLIVNGAIVAKQLVPNRTYGAATGKNSVIPAEIINFDPTLYQWGSVSEVKSDVTNDSGMDIIDISEIAPRL